MTFYQNKIKEMTMVGWDFSYLEGKIKETDYPFNYVTIVKKYLKRDNQLLDLETGGGEVLLTLDHPFNNTTVTEGYKPNYELCLKRLKPKGVTVLNAFGDDVLPLEDHSFDVIINRHGSYSVSEIKRLLKPGGLFITQQVGGLNNLPLSQLLSPNRQIQPFNLHTELQQFKENGFILIESDEVYSDVKYLDIEAVIFMAKMIEWEFPGFDVVNCEKQLEDIETCINETGSFVSFEHRFYMVHQLLDTGNEII